MDYRTEQFRDKFASASSILGVPTQQIRSAKVRDSISSYSEYEAFFRDLEHMHGLSLNPVVGQLQGKGFSLSDGKTTVILVEHETGLEILYIASSIASVVGFVLQEWRASRQRRGQRHGGHEPQDLEIRRLGADGNIIEEHAHSHHGPGSPNGFPLAVLLESEFRCLNAQIESLNKRVDAMEKARTPQRAKKRKQTKKKK